METIRQNEKIILHSNDGISIKMIFRNLTGKNFQGQKYLEYIRYIAIRDMGFSPGIIEHCRNDIFTEGAVYDCLHIAEVYSFDGNYINITYIIENRGSSDFSQTFNFGLGQDVKIGSSDDAIISVKSNTSPKYISMLANDGKEFKAFIEGEKFGVDALTRYWYGHYSSTYNGLGWGGNVFNHDRDKNYKDGQDSAMAFSWSINRIPAGQIVTRTIKIGAGDTSELSKLSVTFKGVMGKFPCNGSDTLPLTSANKQIEVLADGRIKVDGSTFYAPPVNTYGYDFAYSSSTKGNYDDIPAPEKFTGRLENDTVLYAVWVPHPNFAVTNNSSVQKVNGSDNLSVPEALGNIVIENTTPGTGNPDGTNKIIKQGECVEESAGNASDFATQVIG